MNDASRAVGVLGDLLSKDNKVGFTAAIRADYAKAAAAHQRSQHDKHRVPLRVARAKPLKPARAGYTPPHRNFPSTPVFDQAHRGERA
ncbi:hypothetical protein WH91_21075, partial [Devosia psychrophila]